MAMKIIKRGSLVVDQYGNHGIVVRINIGTDIENHGTIAVWQMDRYEYGADNCEHYPQFEWYKDLTIIEE
jgi:hypothetical protein